MSQIAERTAIAALLLGFTAVPAWADGIADVQTKVDGAMKNTKSFVVTTSYPARAYSSTLVYVAPDRSRVTIAVAATTTDVVTVGNTSYSSKNGTPFERSAVSPDESTQLKTIGHVKVGAVHADVTVDGVTYGAFDTTLPLGAAVAITCTYDKKNYRLVRCANDDVTQTYKKYDDPNNLVETPKNSIEAPKVEAPKGGK